MINQKSHLQVRAHLTCTRKLENCNLVEQYMLYYKAAHSHYNNTGTSPCMCINSGLIILIKFCNQMT